ncbi:unnamed protein product [Linum trigynum]
MRLRSSVVEEKRDEIEKLLTENEERWRWWSRAEEGRRSVDVDHPDLAAEEVSLELGGGQGVTSSQGVKVANSKNLLRRCHCREAPRFIQFLPTSPLDRFIPSRKSLWTSRELQSGDGGQQD